MLCKDNLPPACDVPNLVVKSKGERVTSLNENSPEYYEALNITEKIVHLIIMDQTVNYMPSGVDAFMPTMTKLVIIRSTLKSIEQSDLKPFGDLRELDLSENLIQTLEGDLFEHNLKLQLMDLSGNGLMYIGAEILTPLIYLAAADFSSNECIDQMAFTEELQRLINEIGKECSSRDIAKFLPSTTDQRSLDLVCRFPKYNSEISIENLAGRMCEINNLINPSPNQTVISVNGQTDVVFVNVSILNISGRSVKYMPIGIEKFFPHIKTLIVFRAKLQAITQSDLKNFPELDTIHIYNNNLKTIDSNLFEFNPKIQKINMNVNSLRSLDQGLFKPLPLLEEVIFGQNSIETLDSNLFEFNPEMRMIDFSDNHLKIIGEHLLTPLKKLEKATFFNCACVNKNAENQMEIEEIIAEFKTHCT